MLPQKRAPARLKLAFAAAKRDTAALMADDADPSSAQRPVDAVARPAASDAGGLREFDGFSRPRSGRPLGTAGSASVGSEVAPELQQANRESARETQEPAPILDIAALRAASLARQSVAPAAAPPAAGPDASLFETASARTAPPPAAYDAVTASAVSSRTGPMSLAPDVSFATGLNFAPGASLKAPTPPGFASQPVCASQGFPPEGPKLGGVPLTMPPPMPARDASTVPPAAASVMPAMAVPSIPSPGFRASLSPPFGHPSPMRATPTASSPIPPAVGMARGDLDLSEPTRKPVAAVAASTSLARPRAGEPRPLVEPSRALRTALGSATKEVVERNVRRRDPRAEED